MGIRDRKLLPVSKVAEHLLTIPVATATSNTATPFFLFRPGYYFKFAGLGVGNRAEAGAVTLDARIVRGDGPVSNPNLRTDGSEPEDYESDAFTYAINGVLYQKALVDGGDFTAAHVVTAEKFGVILFQIATNGTISTKVPAATATTAMAFESYDEAVRNLPAPDASNAPIGYLVIEADSGNWTANTDSLTDDLTEATWVNGPLTYYAGEVPVLSPMSAPVAAVSGAYVEGTVSTTDSDLIGDENDLIVLTFTTDGSGALTAGSAVLRLRPYPLNGESIPGSYQA